MNEQTAFLRLQHLDLTSKKPHFVGPSSIVRFTCEDCGQGGIVEYSNSAHRHYCNVAEKIYKIKHFSESPLICRTILWPKDITATQDAGHVDSTSNVLGRHGLGGEATTLTRNLVLTGGTELLKLAQAIDELILSQDGEWDAPVGELNSMTHTNNISPILAWLNGTDPRRPHIFECSTCDTSSIRMATVGSKATKVICKREHGRASPVQVITTFQDLPFAWQRRLVWAVAAPEHRDTLLLPAFAGTNGLVALYEFGL